MKPVTAAAIAILAVALAACEKSLDRRYLDATTGRNLELPPDLAQFEVESSFELPASFSGDDPNERNKVPVLAKVEGVRLEGSGALYWLEVDQPVAEVYRWVKEFWGEQGFRLVVDEPVIGVMQTEWVLKEEGASNEDASWIERILFGNDLSATQDQFRTRIERNPDGDGSRIYVAHRGTEYVHVLVTGDRVTAGEVEGNRWQFRQPEPELEIEMLSRLMIHLGLEKSEVDRQVESIRMFTPRALMRLDLEENSPYLIMRDPYRIAWNRVYHELERLNFPIIAANFKNEILTEGYITFESKVLAEKGGGFFSFGASKEIVAKKFTLVLSEESHELTRVEIENDDGDLDTTPEGAELLTLLHQQLR